MAVELPMFALRSRRACGECKTAEAMRILAIGRWGRVLHHVKCGGGGGGVGGWGWGCVGVGGVRLLQIRRLESVADRLKADEERRGCGAAGAARRSLWMRRWLRLFSVGRWARLVLKVKHSGSWETIVYGVMGGRFSYRGALLGFETLSPRCGQSET